MTHNTSAHVRKVGGVRFAADAIDSSNKHEENPHENVELDWERRYDSGERSYDLYFGVLKLSHSYTMTMDVIFHQSPVELEAILDDQHKDGLQVLVTELPHSNSENRTIFQVEVVINAETVPGPFQRTILLREKSTPEERPVTVTVSGKILREGQGTATLRHGVHMKSLTREEKEDDTEDEDEK
ncbi:unnamed protein product [Didymodactylos carnosus]|uniref:Uncharacterized protein n=1 Tax=Didymodactylos carnosus TaxID=1234261 RepID=A0A814ZWQ3_9BILA|nr:unnamed protein product [Didymodactylos carnosus]CAF1248661.1 unnamed protein product [Didymodactylos carnosus]CAF3547274.1 unnamed protein product [Didymodactylos carnosus]CAF4016548.1 unnamed protein product [Didymodactylos carnosus]